MVPVFFTLNFGADRSDEVTFAVIEGTGCVNGLISVMVISGAGLS